MILIGIAPTLIGVVRKSSGKVFKSHPQDFRILNAANSKTREQLSHK
jgi:hypothetical protein